MRVDLAQLSADLQSSIRTREDMGATIEAMRTQTTAATAEQERLRLELADAFRTIMADREKIQTHAAELARLMGQIESLRALKSELEAEIARLGDRQAASDKALIAEKELSESARAQVALLNRQIAALRDQVAQLNAALDISEKLSAEQKAQIANLGQRLNAALREYGFNLGVAFQIAALASRVQELARYRSEFFGRLREVLGNHPGIRIVGDRFVFQSEVLFESASADLGPEGQAQIAGLAATLRELAQRIPAEIDWVLRVDGHTDSRPITSVRFPSNWELSTARAISVVKTLIGEGIPPNRLAAAGFGEYQPLDPKTDEIALRRNRRIELKLDQR